METNIQIKQVETFSPEEEIECGFLPEGEDGYYVGEYEFRVKDEMYLEVTFPPSHPGMVYAKRGVAISWDEATFEYVPFDVNGGNLMGQLGHLIKRKLTGENLGLMQSIGSGKLYLAENANHVKVEVLEKGDKFTVESENILMFNELCEYDTKLFLEGSIMQSGLFTTNITAKRTGATVAIQGKGNILRRETPCKVDPDAVVAWSGPNPSVKLTDKAVSVKTAVGMASGETYALYFDAPGHIVYIQAYERNSGIDIGVDGDNTGEGKDGENALGNSMDNINELLDSAGVDPKEVMKKTDKSAITGLLSKVLRG